MYREFNVQPLQRLERLNRVDDKEGQTGTIYVIRSMQNWLNEFKLI
jgi:hypothetical protein